MESAQKGTETGVYNDVVSAITTKPKSCDKVQLGEHERHTGTTESSIQALNYALHSQAAVVRRLLCISVAVVTVAFLTAAATLALALFLMMYRTNDVAVSSKNDGPLKESKLSQSKFEAELKAMKQNISTIQSRVADKVRQDEAKLDMEIVKSVNTTVNGKLRDVQRDITKLEQMARKVISNSGGKHPLGSNFLLYLPRALGGRGLKSVKTECKQIKIKSAIRLYRDNEPTMSLVRAFEKYATTQGHQSLLKESAKFSEEFGVALELSFPEPKCRDRDGQEVPSDKLKRLLKRAVTAERQEKIQDESCQGKFLSAKWEDDKLNQRRCWDWLRSWTEAPSHAIVGIVELYEQLTPTKLYTARKVRTTQVNDVICRMCNKASETLPHVLAGCPALAQKKYLSRHDAALKVLFFEKVGRGLRSTETEYKETRVKAAVNLYQNIDPAMKMARDFEEPTESAGHQALTKEAAAFARGYGLQLQLEYPDPVCVTEEGEVISGKKIKNLLKRHRESRIREEVREPRWHGKLITERERDEELSAERCLLVAERLANLHNKHHFGHV
ncbi:hypothetical protein AWC38_SpisGene18108 [Stylophora pistillata]|uniref:Uncharacterized protein n=1 Tax=Stylophora pistillata TaxID=50429 RepID=A0A2B4RL83_STYPI|nr:hypothetical protein AWC38_SpisGene18108 [Stylophora pistillata]